MVPTAVTVYPGETVRRPAVWVEAAYDVIRWSPMDQGYTFPAHEVPRLWLSEARSFAVDVDRHADGVVSGSAAWQIVRDREDRRKGHRGDRRGTGSGGEALCRRFAATGALRVVIADVVEATLLADEIGATAVLHDVAVEQDSIALVDYVEREFGRIDLFCANAGVFVAGGVEVPDSEWHRVFQANFMAHVYAARALLPGWLARGRGYFLQTASAAALLTPFGALPYAATKHADLALAESLALEYGHLGVRGLMPVSAEHHDPDAHQIDHWVSEPPVPHPRWPRLCLGRRR